MFRPKPLDTVVPGGWLAVAGSLAVLLAGLAPDDMFITFRYAWNLAHGEGLVFNPGERVFGLTNPGHAVGLALLHGVTRVPVHLLATTLFAIALWCLAALVWLELRGHGRRIEAALGGTLVLGSSYLWAAAGSASAAVMALLAGSALLLPRRPMLAGLLAGIAFWYRPDAAVGIAALGLLRWAETRRFPWRWSLGAGAVLVVGFVSAWLWFGSPLPDTLEAKRTMASARENAWIGERFWQRGVPLYGRHFGPAWSLLLALGVAGQWPLFRSGGLAVRTLVLYGTGVAVAYPLLGVPFYIWYTVPPVTALLFGIAAFVGGAGRALVEVVAPRRGEESRGGRLRPAIAVGVAVAFGLALFLPLRSAAAASVERFRSFGGGQTRFDAYREAALWLREHSLPEERVAYAEIGMLGYWSRRPVDDPLGLVTPESLPYVAEGDWVGAILRRPPEFFLDHPASPHPGIVNLPWFQRAYYPIAQFPGDAPKGTAVLYRMRPGAELPPPRPPAVRGGRINRAPASAGAPRPPARARPRRSGRSPRRSHLSAR